MNEKVVVLGANGMLGQMAVNYFSSRYETLPITYRYDLANRHEFLDLIRNSGKAYILNCIGKIKQKTDDPIDLAVVNALLPLDIYNSLSDDQYLIHPSTDCVFEGSKEGFYKVDEVPDASDDYGWSKRLGEQALIGKSNAYIARVSIIGPDKINKHPSGLMGWFLQNPPGTIINGYTNHLWNGITTLEWCKLVEKLIFSDTGRKMTGRVIQFGTTDFYSKFEMLNIFQKIFKTEYFIKEFATEKAINRCLQPDYFSKDLEHQLEEIKAYS